MLGAKWSLHARQYILGIGVIWKKKNVIDATEIHQLLGAICSNLATLI